MTLSDVFALSLEEISHAIGHRQISIIELTERVLQQIELEDRRYHAFITLMRGRALAQATIMEREMAAGRWRGPLHGVPIAIKDNIYTAGTKTTSGSELFDSFIPDTDAEVVRKLEQAGAILIGKTNMSENAYGTVGDRSFYGVPNNPVLPGKMTGGSSSGSAAAVAAHLVFGAIGSDTGGSVRIPASACGVVGMKPTFGRIRCDGVHPLAWSLDHLGPMTRTVRDNAVLLNAMQGFESKEDFTADIGQSIAGRTVGVPANFYFDIMQNEVKAAFETAVEGMKLQGARIRRIEIPMMDELLKVHHLILAAEAYAVFEQHVREAPNKIDRETYVKIMGGKDISASDYVKANRRRQLLTKEIKEIMESVDVVVTPTMCALPCDIGQRELDFQGSPHHTKIYARLTGPANTLGFPAISVPGATYGACPVGIQLMGPPLSEKTLYQFAYAIERGFALKEGGHEI